jgi:hypothetical protein
MPHSLLRSFSASADQQSISLTRSEGFPGAFRLSSASIWENSDQHVHGDSRPVEREWSAIKRGLMLTLEIAVGTVACAGTILTIFACTDGSL